MPLLALFGVWFAGRITLLFPDLVGTPVAISVDCAFLPVLLTICAREVIAGKKWKDIKILGGLVALSTANAAFDTAMLTGGDVTLPSRLAIAAYLMLIAIVGGRILPSFTRNWLAKNGATDFPKAYDEYDTMALLLALSAMTVWVVAPGGSLTGMLLLAAAMAHAWRLVRWKGWLTWREGLVLVLHVAYGFVVAGFLAAGLAAFGLIEYVAALHVLTVGCIGTMTLAVMTRATRGHTGLDLHASRVTLISYGAMILSAMVRPATAILPDLYLEIVSCAGLLWMAAFALYLVEYASPLVGRRKDLPYVRGKD
jgi:uncharacterized protein involved in response to NO